MPTLYNHTHHFAAERYKRNNPQRYKELRDEGGLHATRILPCTSPDDIVQLDPRLRSAYDALHKHLNQIGIEISANILWDTSSDVSAKFPGHDWGLYLFNAEPNRARPNDKRYHATEAFNNKNSFITHCQDNGHPAPRTIMVNEARSFVPPTNLQFPVYVKAARSSSGRNIFKCYTYEEVARYVSQIDDECQIQEAVPENASFLNVQYQGINGQAVHLATTEQLLHGFTYVGNRFPATLDPRHVTDRLAQELVDAGLEDVFAFDVAATPESAFIIECNARWNGATYPTFLARRLGVSQWAAIKISTRSKEPRDIHRLNDLVYDKARKSGIVVLNNSFMGTNGELSLFLAGPPDLQDELERRAIAIFE